MPTEREQIAAAYQQQLGRAASEDELNKWLSGAYGWGQAGNIAPILSAIGQSGEAQGYRTGQAGGGQSQTQQAVLGLTGRDQLRRGTTGTMLGFNLGDYGGDVKARTSVKNTFSRIASRYANTPGSVDAMMNDPDFKAAFPNAKKVGHDKIDFGGVRSDFESGTPVGVVDVLQASDPTRNTATGWQWLPEDVAQGGPANAAYNQTQNAIVGVPSPTTTTSTTVTGPTTPTVTPTAGGTGDGGDELARYYELVAAYMAQAELDAQERRKQQTFEPSFI